ncbi:MAG: amidohydrolase family protein [Desulfobacteraceae bacterium]|nr:amidohydrolase family protein [Desulfobacteraceae bacterium]
MDRLLVRGKLLITHKVKPSVEPATVLIEGGKIVALGQEAESRAEQVEHIMNCRDQTLLPGLIDCHNHLSLDPTIENYLYRMNDSIPELTIRATLTMPVDLKSGVTTSRCLGDKGFLDIDCKKAVTSGLITGPRLLVATRGIRAPHGHGFVGYPFGGVEQIRLAVRENLAAGADLIKIYITGTLRPPNGIHSYFSREEIQVAVDEAHRVGAPVAAHCIGGIGLKWALEAGIDVIEHGYFIDEEEIELLLRSGKWLVMTPSIFYTDARIQTLPSNLIDGHYKQRHEVAESMAAAIKAGVKYAVGTDGMHGGMAQELKYLTGFGASPADALKAATLSAARVCHMEDSIGALEPGKSADLIGVEGDPLKDIEALKKVKTVILQGRQVL